MDILRISQLAVSLGFVACIVLYIYLMVVRRRKGKNVDMQIWIVIAVGLLLSVVSQYLGVVQGVTSWDKVKYNMLVSGALVVFAIWMIYKTLNPGDPKPKQQPKSGKPGSNKQGKKKKK